MRMRARGSRARVIDGSYGAEMTQKQKLFIAEYLIDMNATKAAIRAGYSRKTACEQGSRMLANVKISAAIAEVQARRFEELGIKAERVLQELALLGFSNMLDYISVGGNGGIRVDLAKLTRDQAAAIQEVTVEEYVERTGEDGNSKPTFENVKRVKFKLNDKRGALELLGKHLKLFTEKVEHSGRLGLTPDFMDSLLGDD
jgi:phage terminase small subunit